MRLTTRVRNLIFLLKQKKPVKSSYIFDSFYKQATKTYEGFKKGGVERDLVAKVIKMNRAEYPYKVKGWRSAEREYNNYFKREDAVKDLKEGDFIVKYRGTYPVKGYKQFQYYKTTYTQDVGEVFRVGKYKERYKSHRITTARDYDSLIGSEDITAFRFATEEEKKEYYLEKDRREKLQTKIEQLQKEINELRGEL